MRLRIDLDIDGDDWRATLTRDGSELRSLVLGTMARRAVKGLVDRLLVDRSRTRWTTVDAILRDRGLVTTDDLVEAGATRTGARSYLAWCADHGRLRRLRRGVYGRPAGVGRAA